jgi:hypothetical protein
VTKWLGTLKKKDPKKRKQGMEDEARSTAKKLRLYVLILYQGLQLTETESVTLLLHLLKITANLSLPFMRKSRPSISSLLALSFLRN